MTSCLMREPGQFPPCASAQEQVDLIPLSAKGVSRASETRGYPNARPRASETSLRRGEQATSGVCDGARRLPGTGVGW